MYNITHIFDVDGNKYALDFQNIVFCHLDDDTHFEMEKILSTLDYDRNSMSGIALYIQNGFFITDIKYEERDNFYYDNTLYISFAPIHDCNLSCKYCYASGGKATPNYKSQFNEEKIDQLLDYIYVKKYSQYFQYKFDFVSGGEPFLNQELLELVLQKIRIKSEQHKKKTTIFIVTNGTLLNTNNIKMIDQYDVFLGISIDGPEKIHNLNRVYKNGTGSYQNVVSGISTLKRLDVSNKLKDAWAMVVVTKSSGSLVNIMESCIALGFRRMQMQIQRMSPKSSFHFQLSDLEQLKQNYKELFSHLIAWAKQGDLTRIKMIANDNDSFGKYLARLLLRKPVYYRCFAGKNKISVAADGKIYPCDSFCGETNFCMGSIYGSDQASSIREKFVQASVENRGRCSTCWARYLCGGDCYHNSFLFSNNIFDPDPFVCEINKFFIESAIDLLIRLKYINENYISYLTRFLGAKSF